MSREIACLEAEADSLDDAKDQTADEKADVVLDDASESRNQTPKRAEPSCVRTGDDFRSR